MPSAAYDAQALTLMPEVRARRLLQREATALRLSVLRPPYAALGLGALRVLRVRETGGITDVVAGYDRYERLEPKGS